MRISEHVSYNEAVHSDTAKRLGIVNVPNEEQLSNMVVTVEKIFEPIRNKFNVPIFISSFFRSKQLNRAIGGSNSSQHCEGKAMDIDSDRYNEITNSDIFYYIKNNVDFDQLIWEFGTSINPDWVHASYESPTKNRKEILVAFKQGKKTKYRFYNG